MRSQDLTKGRFSRSFRMKEQAIMVPINLHLFEWVIENLCKNAVDAMEGDGMISIEITEDIDHIHIDVDDTGKGIPKSRLQDHIPGRGTPARHADGGSD